MRCPQKLITWTCNSGWGTATGNSGLKVVRTGGGGGVGGLELLNLANKDTGHPVKCKFYVNIS